MSDHQFSEIVASCGLTVDLSKMVIRREEIVERCNLIFCPYWVKLREVLRFSSGTTYGIVRFD